MRILIVGGGIGGLTLAAFLRESQIEYEVVDRAQHDAPAGYSIGLWENGRRMLERLGLAEGFEAAATRIREYCVHDESGKILKRYRLDDFYSLYGMAYSHIDRAELIALLRSKVDGDRITHDRRVVGIVEHDHDVEVSFSDGSKGVYDFIVGADGIASVVRESIIESGAQRYDDWRVWYAWINTDNTVDAVVEEYVGAGTFAATFDVGPRTLLVLIAPAHHATWDDAEGRLDRLKKIFSRRPEVGVALEQLKADNIVPTDLRSVTLNRWYSNRVVLLGDAAHGFEPHAGLGGSMAMEDAYVLAARLMQVGPEYPHEKAFFDYQQARQTRVRLARKLTRRMKAWSFIHSRIMRKIVNIFVRCVPVWFFTRAFHRLMRERI